MVGLTEGAAEDAAGEELGSKVGADKLVHEMFLMRLFPKSASHSVAPEGSTVMPMGLKKRAYAENPSVKELSSRACELEPEPEPVAPAPALPALPAPPSLPEIESSSLLREQAGHCVRLKE
jgi:hypothetical protein